GVLHAAHRLVALGAPVRAGVVRVEDRTVVDRAPYDVAGNLHLATPSHSGLPSSGRGLPSRANPRRGFGLWCAATLSHSDRDVKGELVGVVPQDVPAVDLVRLLVVVLVPRGLVLVRHHVP